MPEIELVKTIDGELRGFTAKDQDAWERFKTWWRDLEAGEFFTLIYRRPRSIKYHRRFFKMLTFAFQHWEPERARKRLTYKGQPIAKDFEKFREEVTILAGFYTATYDIKGKVSLEAKSIAFDQMEDDEFGRLYKAVKDVLFQRVLHDYSGDDVERVLEELERF